MADTQTIILASGSPRRRELLGAMGVRFDIVPSSFEEHLDDGRSPEDVACELALGKAKDVAVQYPDHVVLGADTIVTVDGRQLGKPADEAEALDMLKLLAGREHEVTTGVAIVRLADNMEIVRSDTATVFFKPYDEPAVVEYVQTGDPLDKAGAYGIQSGAAPLIDSMQGTYDTIIGLPTELVTQMLKNFDIAATPVHLVPTVPLRNR